MRKFSWLIFGAFLVLCLGAVLKQTTSIYILDPSTSDPAIKIRFANGHASSVIEIADAVGNNKFTLGTNGILGTAYGGTGISSASGLYLGGDGTASAVTFGFQNDPDTGMFRSATNALGFSTGGTERWVINSSGALNPVANNVYDIGNGLVNPRDITVARNLLVKGEANIGGTTTGGTTLEVNSLARTITGDQAGDAQVNVAILTTNAVANDTGAILGLGGIYEAGGGKLVFGAIAGRRSTGADGYLSLYSYKSSSGLTEAFRVKSVGDLSSPFSFSATNGVASYRSNLVAPASFTFPATTVNWTNPLAVNIQVYIDNGGVTGTSVRKNGVQIFTLMTGPATIGLQPGEYFSQTYTVGTPVGTYSPF